MDEENKKFTFQSSVAGGFVAGGTLLTYQLVLGWGNATPWLAGLIAILVGFVITILAKRKLFKK